MFIWVSCTGGLEAAQIDEVVDAVNDIAQAGAKAFFSKDEAEMKKYTTETLPAGLINIEKRLESRGGQFMVGNTLGLDNFPGIKNLTGRVGRIPNIQAWLEARPESEI